MRGNFDELFSKLRFRNRFQLFGYTTKNVNRLIVARWAGVSQLTGLTEGIFSFHISIQDFKDRGFIIPCYCIFGI